RGHLDRREESESEERPPLRRRSRQGFGRTPGQRRAGCRQDWPLWTLCEPQRHQRDHYRRQDTGDDHADRGRRATRRPRRTARTAPAPRGRPQKGGRALGSTEGPQEEGGQNGGRGRENRKAAKEAGEK